METQETTVIAKKTRKPKIEKEKFYAIKSHSEYVQYDSIDEAVIASGKRKTEVYVCIPRSIGLFGTKPTAVKIRAERKKQARRSKAQVTEETPVMEAKAEKPKKSVKTKKPKKASKTPTKKKALKGAANEPWE